MAPTFRPHFQGTLLWDMPNPLRYAYEAITLYRVPFQGTSASKARVLRQPKHHISNTLLRQIQFALYGFQSPLLTISQLISFPAGTKTFQFPAFPFLTELNEKSH